MTYIMEQNKEIKDNFKLLFAIHDEALTQSNKYIAERKIGR